MMENVADNAIDVMKQTIIFGNIITMDEKRPFARAALVKNGVFAYIGEAEEAKRLAGPGAQVLDYGDNYIYPGFLESHCMVIWPACALSGRQT